MNTNKYKFSINNKKLAISAHWPLVRIGNSQGFTLIELLIVITIIGVLAALVSVNLQDARVRARDVQRKSDIRAIRNALELYKNDQPHPRYSADLADLVTANYVTSTPEDPLYKQSGRDPLVWSDYIYTFDAGSPLIYSLSACLENGSDVDADINKPVPTANLCTLGESYTLNEP